MDSISRQAAIEIVDFECGEWRGLAKTIAERLSGLPSAQPEIVRCKDCKHRRAGTMYSYCEKLYRMGVLDIYCYMQSDDDFCSMAERR